MWFCNKPLLAKSDDLSSHETELPDTDALADELICAQFELQDDLNYKMVAIELFFVEPE